MSSPSPTGVRDPVADSSAETVQTGTAPVTAAQAPSLTSPLRLAGYAAILVALCFVQSPRLMVADTKFDLLTEPWRFLRRGLELWDPLAAFGQVPDQAYGYAWPMGPFFGLGELAQLPPWVVQRLWWALLLCVAFFGILRLTTRLGLGTDLTRVLAAFLYVLTPRITTLVGVVSVEVWPMALAPWVLLPLVKGSREGSVRRAAAASALVVATCGGVNAVAVAAVLPLGVLWLLTRERGPRRWRLLAWWTGLTVLATAWWSGPLVLMGHYSAPFLDYIENATITTVPTDLTRTLLGVSDWVAYFGGVDFDAGRHIVGTPFLLVDAGLVAALGLVGIAMRDNPHRRFLTWGLLAGLALVGFGYSRDLAGFFSETRMQSLDHALAALRNLHKFDVVLRIPLILGMAHALARMPALIRGRAAGLAGLSFRVTTALAVLGLLTPWLLHVVPAQDGVKGVPRYWADVAHYLAQHDDGSVALELPASSFGVYGWGNVHDDVLQGLARSPWAVRNVVPLAQPGNVVFLDAVTKAVELGRPSPELAAFLAANNVGRIVVRNDLDRVVTGAPDPAYVRSVLAASPGIRLERTFGPLIGEPPYRYAEDSEHTRLVTGSGISDLSRAIEVYKVAAPAGATLSNPRDVLVGDPGSPASPGTDGLSTSPRVLAADARDGVRGQVLTDGMKRQEMNFPAVRWNESNTFGPHEQFRLPGKEQSHRVVSDEARWETVESWVGGIDGVTASSSQSYADATPPLAAGSHPGAVFDADTSTSWQSARDQDPDGQWLQVRFTQQRTVGTVSVTVDPSSVRVRQLRISGGGQSRVVTAPRPGGSTTYRVGLPKTRALRVTALHAGGLLTGSVALSELSVDSLRPQRFLDMPAGVQGRPADAVVMARDQDRMPCAQVRAAFKCDDVLVAPGEDGDTLARRFQLPAGASYTISATASLRRLADAWKLLLKGTGTRIWVRPQPVRQDPAQAPGAMVDGDPATSWVATRRRPVLVLELARPTRLHRLRLTLKSGAPAARPQRVEVRSRSGSKVVDLDSRGRGRLPHWKVQRLRLRIDSTFPAFADTGNQYVELDAGVTELKINGRSLTSSVFRNVVLPCGSGPKFYLGGTIYDTSLTANVRDLVRGRQVPLQVCAPAVGLPAGATMLVAPPTTGLRVDSVTLTRRGATAPTARRLEVRRDASGAPDAVRLPSRSATALLTLPQNINNGWQATLDGKQLRPRRVDGWKQGWLVPAGRGGEVHLDYGPTTLFRISLVVGVVLLLLVIAAALPIARRRDAAALPALRDGRPGWMDAAVAVCVAGWLAGWVGLGMVLLVVLAVRRFRDLDAVGGWGTPAGLALLVAVVGLTWGPIKEQGWALSWSQVWATAAVTAVSAPLLGVRLPRGLRRFREARAARPSART